MTNKMITSRTLLKELNNIQSNYSTEAIALYREVLSKMADKSQVSSGRLQELVTEASFCRFNTYTKAFNYLRDNAVVHFNAAIEEGYYDVTAIAGFFLDREDEKIGAELFSKKEIENYYAADDCVRQLWLHPHNPGVVKRYTILPSGGHKNYFICGEEGDGEPYIVVHLNRHIYSYIISDGLDRMIQDIRRSVGLTED